MINVKGVNENEKLQEIDHKLLYFIFYFLLNRIISICYSKNTALLGELNEGF